MSKLITAILVKNEADRYLERVLTRCLSFSDEVLVLDDGSTDGSDRLAWRLGCRVHPRKGTGMWGNEAPARAELWEWGREMAGDDGWLLICDADMLLHGDPRPLTLSTQVNAWAWKLWDLWDDEHRYRCDGYWMGHLHPRIWMVKPNAMWNVGAEWPDRGLHTGHFPLNFPYNTGVRDDFGWLHLAYLDPEHREQKLQQYLAKADQLTPFEKAHAMSIGDLG